MVSEEMHKKQYKEDLFNSNDLELIKKIINEGFSVNIVDEMGETPIFKATPEKTEILLGEDPNLYAKNKKGNDVLMSTLKSKMSEKNKLKKCELLIEYGYDISRLKGDMNPLFYVAESSIAEYLIRKGVSPLDLNSRGQNISFNVKISYELLEKYKDMGVDINHKDLQSQNAIMNLNPIDSDEKLMTLKNLLQAGVDPYYTGETKAAVHPLLKRNKQNGKYAVKIIEAFHKCKGFKFAKLINKQGKNALFFANKIEEIEKLIKYGTGINVISEDGRTALFDNCDDFHIANSLIKHGADVNVKHGGRPLIFEVCNQLIPVLKEYGYDINITNKKGENAAFGLKDKETLKKRVIILKECGLNFLHVSNDGLMALDALPPKIKDWSKEILGEEFAKKEKAELEESMKNITSVPLPKGNRI